MQPRSDFRRIFNMARQRGMQRVADPAAFTPVEPDAPHSDLVDVVPPEVQPAGERRMIRLTEADFSSIVDELEEVLNPFVYTQGSYLTRTREAHSDGAIQRSASALMLLPATKDWARKRFGELCDFKRYIASREEWVSVAPSLEHINTMLGLGSWNTLRPLDALARAPFLRADGSICDVPGYDSASRTLYVPSTTYPPILANP